VAPSQSRIAHDSLQFLVQKSVPALPVDAGVDGGKEKRGEGGEKPLQYLFPRGVMIGHRAFRSNSAASLRAVPATTVGLWLVQLLVSATTEAPARARQLLREPLTAGARALPEAVLLD
jgi:hypothetical protein